MNCLFCKIINGELEKKVIYEDDIVIAILDAYPDVDGHTLIIPKKHSEDIYNIDEQTLLHIYKVAKDLSKILMQKLNCKSITHLINYGDSKVIKHFHYHLLPNYKSSPTKTTDEILNIIKD